MNNRPKLLLLLLVAGVACRTKQQTVQVPVFEPALIAICVEDIEISVNWYVENLAFNIEQSITAYPDYGLKLAFLEKDGFHLEILEKTNSYDRFDVLPDDEYYLGGVFKIGFTVQDLQMKYDQLQQMEDVMFVAGLGELPKSLLPIQWPTKYFLIQDPDGNFIQFFDGGMENTLAPWLFMITVDNLENAITWYTENLGFKHHQTIGNPGNQRAVLERNNYILELFEPEKIMLANMISPDSMVLGFSKIAFAVDNINPFSSAFEKDSLDIIASVESSDLDWATKAMIVKDAEGNWIQLFERK